MEEDKKVRIDKWLWAARMFKTRTLATDACNAGRVKVNGKSIKPSRKAQIGDEITVQKGQDKKIWVVQSLIEKRVSYSLAQECYEDKSPPPLARKPFQKMDSVFFDYPVAHRERGAGRPTKKDRRTIDKYKDME